MTAMLQALISKDFARARRSPLQWLVFLLVPLLLVALIGAFFGGFGKPTPDLGRIRFALVDEDNSPVTRLLRGALGQGEAAQRLEPVLMDRPAAIEQIGDNKLSAVVIIPSGFSASFLRGQPTRIELVKNPAEAIKPTAMEEMLGVVTAGLDAVGRNFSQEIDAARVVFEGGGDYRVAAAVITRSGDKLATMSAFLKPPLVGYTKPAVAATGEAAAGTGFNLLGHLLLGMAAMFLLFLGGLGMGDLHREIELKTLARFCTLHDSVRPMILAKVVFTWLMLALCSLVLFGGGAWVFGVHWNHPAALATLTATYLLFIAGLMACVVSWIPERRKADSMRTVLSMLLGMAGGCAFPTDQLPAVFRERVMPLMPTDWFAGTARTLEYGGGIVWWPAALKLAVCGALMLVVASAMFRRRFGQGDCR
jgi:hypothetical protein